MYLRRDEEENDQSRTKSEGSEDEGSEDEGRDSPVVHEVDEHLDEDVDQSSRDVILAARKERQVSLPSLFCALRLEGTRGREDSPG
jgi:hypothetical protein